jgi:hypothetical protein
MNERVSDLDFRCILIPLSLPLSASPVFSLSWDRAWAREAALWDVPQQVQGKKQGCGIGIGWNRLELAESESESMATKIQPIPIPVNKKLPH